MARYLAVTAVRKEGRRIAVEGAAQPPDIAPGERLIAVVNNGEWQSAIDVTFPTFYDRIYRRYRDGIWKEMELYGLDQERAVEFEDGRRFLMNGQPVQDPGRP